MTDFAKTSEAIFLMDIKSDAPSEADVMTEQIEIFDSFPIPSMPQAVPSTNSSGKKRKLSGESVFDPDLSSEQYIIQDISESRNPTYNCDLPTGDAEFLEMPTPVKRTFDKKELNTLRIQIAMLSDLDGDRPIHVAVAQEDIKLVRKLCSLMLKATISLDLTNYLRQTPLHLAVMLCNKDLIALLLKYGACINLRDRRGSSVLHLAVKSEAKKDVLTLVLSHPETKAFINMLDYEGYSALHYAVMKNNRAAIRCFHSAGAKMDVADGKSGRSPLIQAVLDQNVEIVSLLLECGAVPDIVDYSGRSAFEFALCTSNKRISKLVERNMSSADAVHHAPATILSKETDGSSISDSSTRTRSERFAARSKRICNSNKKKTL